MSFPPEILAKTLQELEKGEWDDPVPEWNLVARCYAAARVPLKDLSVENLRLLIGQTCSLDYLVPLAIDRLTEEPWASGDYYDGDLLQNVLSVPPGFWSSHPDLDVRMDGVVRKALDIVHAADSGDADWLFERRVLDVLEKWVERSR